ncbi:glycerophosphodiester phosphodiesterase [Clostridium sp. NSJ-145]|jgi:glycerophosphoryl diester phosphodiesterase|uniref:glycerophosphodiester phosphodiesterase n=1 Tax=Clostridium sp. NSJ-145 TaxID=2897777 RepID=UPI001E39F140|nr:glycerophosphodiester phosphodiesterase [Clostridium sp. NSJ-145]MCD2501350.1 glycerophosphodiester phosphodiesterase [Clostridium sp. NSJ-145]
MTKNFAHRGFSSKYPENTLLAFEKAIEVGVDGMEFDVQLTKDGEIVIIHDETIDRTSNGSGRVKDFTYEELLQYDFSASFTGQFGYIKIPLLREYFDLVKDTEIISNIELKNSVYDYEDLEEKVYELIVEYGLDKKVIISSFNHESIIKMKKIDSEIKCGFLSDCWMIEPGKYTKAYGIECFHPAGYYLTGEKVKAIHNEGIEVNVWLGKEPMDYRKLIDMEIDVLISNDPDIVGEILKNK